MSAELYSASGPVGNNEGGTTLGGTKPLHRFIKGQPKIVGIIVLVLGVSFFMLSISLATENNLLWTVIPPGFILGTLYIICGILYILTEHNPTKKTVTMSLALSIVTVLGVSWTVLNVLPEVIHAHYYRHYEFLEDNITETDETEWGVYYEAMGMTLETIFVFYSFVGAVIFIAMSTLAASALRSTKSQAVLVLNTAANESPVE